VFHFGELFDFRRHRVPFQQTTPVSRTGDVARRTHPPFALHYSM
jgi:hypothetical protein